MQIRSSESGATGPRGPERVELESLHLERAAGVEMIIAIDSTARGPALGGCRWKPYTDVASARTDASALARAMTLKAALAGLPLGGGKAVVIGDPAERTREQLLALGRFVEALGGDYVAAADMGTSESEMAVISETTSHVIGHPRRLGGCGEPAPHTALGVCLAVEAALAHLGRTLEGASVLVQGAGQVGSRLAELLAGSGAEVSVAETDPAALSALRERVPGVRVVEPQRLLETPCDVLAPCGPPAVIQSAELACRVVCGAANNPLANRSVASELERRGILCVPDFVANAGGLIYLAAALAAVAEGRPMPDPGGPSRERLRAIPRNLRSVLQRAAREATSPLEAAERSALEALAASKHHQDLG